MGTSMLKGTSINSGTSPDLRFPVCGCWRGDGGVDRRCRSAWCRGHRRGLSDRGRHRCLARFLGFCWQYIVKGLILLLAVRVDMAYRRKGA